MNMPQLTAAPQQPHMPHVPPGHSPPLFKGRFKLDIPAAVVIGGDKRRADHDVVLRPMHVYIRALHDLLHDGDGIAPGCRAADLHNDLYALFFVALVTDIVPILAGGAAFETPVAEYALHLPGRLVIHYGLAADQACALSSFYHGLLSFSGAGPGLFLY